MFSLLMMFSCNSSDDIVIIQDDDTPSQEPLPPNRGINMNLSLKVKFINNNDINILDPENQIVNANDIDVDIYGIDGYENEYPYNPNYNYGEYITFINYESIGYCIKLNNYEDKSEALQQAFGERGWLKYKITFPDDVVYEVKVEGALIPNSTIDYYPTKIFVNDELKWQQPQGSNSGYMDITIVK